MAVAVPAAIIPGCYNSALIKLFLFTLSAGLLLVFLGLKMIKDTSLPENLPIHLLLLVPAVTVLHVYAPSNPGVTRILLVSSAAGIFIVIRAFRLERKKILIPVLSGGSFAILVSLFLHSSSQRLAGVFSNANLLGSFAAGLLPVGFTFLLGKGWKKVLLLLLFLILCITSLIMTGTRSSVIAMAGATAAVLCIRWKPGLLNLLLVLFFVAATVTVFLPQLPLPAMGGTPGVRQVIWEGSSRMFFQKPLFGWGNGSFQLLFPRFRSSDFFLRGVSTNTVHAHSEPLEILAESGLIGFVLWAALIIILLKQALNKRKKTLIEWGIITGVIVLLLEGLTSVALRWTTSVYLMVMLMSLMPAGQSSIKKLPRWTAVLPVVVGLLLLPAGAYKVYRMTRSSISLNSAMTALATGETTGTARDLCLESLRYNSWELGSWYTLGNIYGREAATATDLQTAVVLVEKQLTAYHSLSVRAENFASMRVNRVDAFLKLGMFDSAMDDVIYLYKHRQDMKDFCMDTGYRIAPLVSPGKSFEFMNIAFLEVLVQNWQTNSTSGNTSMRIDRMKSSILTTFAIAVNNAPDVVERMKQATDSILTTCGDSLRNSMMTSIENELQLAPEGYSLLERCNAGDFEGLEQECHEVLANREVYAACHRAVLCLIAAENGNVELADMAYEYAIVLAEPCLPLVSHYPAAGEALYAAARISAAADRSEQVQKYFKLACEIDSYGNTVMNSFRNCCANQPPRELLNFWYRNGGPQASVAFLSPTGLLVPDGETRRLLQLAGTESIEFQIAAHFIIGSLAVSAPGADTEYIATTTSLRLQSQQDAMIEIYGAGEAGRIIIGILNSEIDYLENGPFTPEAALNARRLKSAFETI